MKHLYLGICGLIGTFFLTSLVPNTSTNYLKRSPSAVQSVSPFSQPKTYVNSPGDDDAQQIDLKNGSFAVSLNQSQLQSITANPTTRFNTLLGLSQSYSFEKVAEKTDKYGVSHVYYQQYYKGIAVEGAMVMLHGENGQASFFNGRILKPKQLELGQAISKKRALTLAKEYMNVDQLLQTYPVQTVITQVKENNKRISRQVYKVKIVTGIPITMVNVYVDTKTGEVLKTIDLINTLDTPGSGETQYEGAQNITVDQFSDGYRLQESDRNIKTFDASTFIGINYGYEFLGTKDYVRSGTDFSAGLLTDFQVSSYPQAWKDTSLIKNAYIKLIDGEGAAVYTSNTVSLNTNALNFDLTDHSMYNSEFSVELWLKKADSISTDTIVGTYPVMVEAGTHQWSGDQVAGNYEVTVLANPAVDVHWGMEQTYDFYKEVFGRESYDGNGSVIKQYVNPPANVINTYLGATGMPNNAFALQAPFNVMVYGLGDGTLMNPVVALDVEGHEFSHLVMSQNGTGGLAYQGESGALNESFADIFGTCVEFHANVNPDWEIGAGVLVNYTNMRSMSNPKNYSGMSHQPDTYEGTYWVNPNMPYDNGGVHTNSGVQNYWFYLLSEGGTGTNDNGDLYDVNGIGIAKAQRVAYRSVMNYLSPNATYHDAYAGALQAAKDLYGIPSVEYSAVAAAWYAVGIGDNPHEFCGGASDLTTPSATFGDGSDNNADYVNNAYCSWLIHPDNSAGITLTFSDFETESDADYVVVYDGSDSTATVLGKFSGNTVPQAITSTGPTMYVEFYSNQSVKKAGWTAHYTTEPLGVDSHEMADKLTVYPNPTHGDFTVSSALSGDVQLQIFDITGRQVSRTYTLTEGDNAINEAGLETGVYFLKFTTDGNTQTRKLIVR